MGVHALLCATWAFVRPSRRRARESAGAIVGELAGVAAAIVWATNNIVLRGQSARYGAVTVNAWRAVFASLCFAGIFLLTRGPADLVGIPAGALAALLAGVVAGMVIGDALQLVAMTWIGVSRAMPIGASFPLFTVAIAALFLGERIAARTILGATLVIGGIVLLALPRTPAEPVGLAAESRAVAARADRRRHWQGVGLALLAALCWALATTFTRIAVREIDVITANAIRLPFSAVVSLLLGLVLGRRGGGKFLSPRQFDRRGFIIILLAGVLGTAGGGFLFLTAVALAGAAKTAILASSAPVFGLLGAVIFLGERPGARGVAGTLVAIAGIVLVV